MTIVILYYIIILVPVFDEIHTLENSLPKTSKA